MVSRILHIAPFFFKREETGMCLSPKRRNKIAQGKALCELPNPLIFLFQLLTFYFQLLTKSPTFVPYFYFYEYLSFSF